VYSGDCLKALVNYLPEMLGGCADLAPSCNTKHVDDYQKNNLTGRYLRFGVREHAMAAICNGLFSYSHEALSMVPYCATFMVFWGYAWGSVRLSALSKFPVLYVGTHDSIDLGEDGPTHQPVEILQLMRATPNFVCIRPADGNETLGAYAAYGEEFEAGYKYSGSASSGLSAPMGGLAVRDQSAASTSGPHSAGGHRPFCIVLSRSGAPHIAGSSAEKVKLGAYVIEEYSDADFSVILSGSGQEVDLCVKAKKLLNEKGVKARVVSFPCWEFFEEQSAEYKASVFPAGKTKVYVESASTEFGLSKYADIPICMQSFGTSAPGGAIKKEMGFTPENIVEKVLAYKK